MDKKLIRKLLALGPCDEAMAWLRTQDDPATAWQKCDRGDWMMWLLGSVLDKDSPDYKKFVFVACQHARLVLPIWDKYSPGDDRICKCIETTELWTVGAATDEEKAAARAAARAVARDAARAAGDAAEAARAAAWDAARAATLAKCADIVREHFPEPPSL